MTSIPPKTPPLAPPGIVDPLDLPDGHPPTYVTGRPRPVGVSSYVRGCRCEGCSAAKQAYDQKRYAATREKRLEQKRGYYRQTKGVSRLEKLVQRIEAVHLSKLTHPERVAVLSRLTNPLSPPLTDEEIADFSSRGTPRRVLTDGRPSRSSSTSAPDPDLVPESAPPVVIVAPGPPRPPGKRSALDFDEDDF